MSKELPIIYISLTGNTHNFVTRLKDHLRFLKSWQSIMKKMGWIL